MATVIDNITLNETNVELNYASDFVKHTETLDFLLGLKIGSELMETTIDGQD